MIEREHESKIFRLFERAAASGVASPIVAILRRDCQRSRSIYRQLHGVPLRANRPRNRRSLAVVEPLPAESAADVLRRHCGIGGRAVANLLEETEEKVWWILNIEIPHLNVAAIHCGGLYQYFVGYDDLLACTCPDCQDALNADTGDDRAMTCKLDDGTTTVVRGLAPRALLEAHQLVLIADGHFLTAMQSEGSPRLPLRDEDLGALLARSFQDKPVVVAETIRALRMAPRHRDGWLTSVLFGAPDLTKLAGAVREELGST